MTTIRQPRHEKKAWSFGMGSRMAKANSYYRPQGVTPSGASDKLKITGMERALKTQEYKGVKYWSRVVFGQDNQGNDISIPLRLVASDNEAIAQVANAILDLTTKPTPENIYLLQFLSQQAGIQNPELLRSGDGAARLRNDLAIFLLNKAIAYDTSVIENPNHRNYPYFIREKNEVESQPAQTTVDFTNIVSQILTSEGKRPRGGAAGAKGATTGIKRASTPRGADAELEKLLYLMDSITHPGNAEKFFEVDEKGTFKLISNKLYSVVVRDQNYATIPPLRIAARVTKGGFGSLGNVFRTLLVRANNDKRAQVKAIYVPLLEQYVNAAQNRITPYIGQFGQNVGQFGQFAGQASTIIQTTPPPSNQDILRAVADVPPVVPMLGQGTGGRAVEPVITPAAATLINAAQQQAGNILSGLQQQQAGGGLLGSLQQQPSGGLGQFLGNQQQQQPSGGLNQLLGSLSSSPPSTGGGLLAGLGDTSGLSALA